MKELVDRIRTGKAVLFCGAGFSYGALNIRNEAPKTSKELAHEICKIGEFYLEDDLRFVSDFLIKEHPEKIPDLITTLKEIYTINSVSDQIKTICNLNWRRIYTTNYDNTIEFGYNQVGRYIDSFSIDENPKSKYKDRNNCVHINGTISNLSKSTLNHSFKLTRSSYVSPTSFENSNWYYSFKKDIEQASAIVFIGYSLYDIEIEKILFRSNFKDKTFFIIHETDSTKTKYTLSQYGEVFTDGINGLAEALNHHTPELLPSTDSTIKYFLKYELTDSDFEITDNEIRKFIDQGYLDSKYVDIFLSGNPERAYLIKREKLELIAQQSISKKHVVIYSDFGNGKTVLLDQLKSYLALHGQNVYYPSDIEGDFASDIDIIASYNYSSIIVIDGYSKYSDLLEYIFNINSDKITLILADRSNNHQRFRELLSKGIEYHEYNIDIISTQEELITMIRIISNLGYWSDKIHWSDERKIKHIESSFGNHISNILIDVFDSPQMKNRLELIVLPLLVAESFKKTIIAICLLEIMDLPTKESLISEVANNDDIYNPELTNNSNFKTLFNFANGKINSKSSVYSYTLLRNYFSSTYLTNTMLEIADKYKDSKTNSREEIVIFKSLLRFSFIEKVLPFENKRASLINYYQNLKSKIKWLERDPHFWLQYGMAELTYNNFPTAQSYFNTAYDIANSKETYDTTYIDTQQARLYIFKSLSENDGNIVIDLFMKAHDLLFPIPNDHYKYRQVLLYSDFYKRNFTKLPSKRRPDFIKACRDMIAQIESNRHHQNKIYTDDYTKRDCLFNLKKIVQEATAT